MSGDLVCWDRKAVAFATQIDVGGLEVGDQRADAVFSAIHQPLPLVTVRDVNGSQETPTTEAHLLSEFTKPLHANEPRLVFVTGAKGTGKSHLVRWLKSQVGPRPNWHIVYIEKRNTNLRRVIERILEGIDTPKATQLREALAKAGSEITSDEEAMSALLARLDHLVQFDQSPDLKNLPEAEPAEIAYLRKQAHRLLGDFTFRQELSRSDGPVRRLVRIALTSSEAAETDEASLHLTEQDLRVDPGRFEDAGQEIQKLVNKVNGSSRLRSEIAALCDSYLERAKAEVFTGPNTNLIEVFEDVRREIKARGHELCLFIEDLVLLHGIDKQLAQALTIPASSELCTLRAAIAVTDGYLGSVSTFADRGILFKVDIYTGTIGREGLRDFVGRYLNAGRLKDEDLLAFQSGRPGSDSPKNACLKCPIQSECHATFGTSSLGHGLFPFNATAVDRLVSLSNGENFRPRFILRHAIRDPLEVAESELEMNGTFPSKEFAKDLDPTRREVPVMVRAAISRENSISSEAEMSLRAFYAKSPLVLDSAVTRIAEYLHVKITDLDDEAVAEEPKPPPTPTDRTQGPAASSKTSALDEFQAWTDKTTLSSGTANKIRVWISTKILDSFRSGPYGLAVTTEGKNSWRIGEHSMRLSDVWIERAEGGGGIKSDNPFEIKVSDQNALMLRGIVAASTGLPLDEIDGGRWYFDLHTRIAEYVDKIARLGRANDDPALRDAATILTVLRNISDEPGTTVADALPSMLIPEVGPGPTSAAVRQFAKDSKKTHVNALITIRDHATAAKGKGAPSLMDTGLIYAHITRSLKIGDFSTTGHDADSDTRQFLQVRLERASNRAWGEIAKVVDELKTRISPDDDWESTRAVIDQLVEVGHAAGKLPYSQSKEQHDLAVSRLQSDGMTIYRKLAKKLSDGVGPADLWQIRNDPLPALQALNHYTGVVDQMLKAIEQDVPAGAGTSTAIETEKLVVEFRELAQVLDDITKHGGRR
ncbi:ATP-binding protein [Amycolatopsis sp. NPDC051371]|uniref:ATP-binding protein n=1 Tax=Amycolatopsis sp. NPDC051371 TaxID=3155800 RepID=UPI00343710BC